ncbi:MAG: hypothetical protein QOG15_295 [Solirubrobacteraceae bacterium]|jgi:hypothetical protein|nr:hypothetical protein [Solirubrobacteraceae bacterium]
MADPTGARQRTINSFFDSPRFPIKALPVIVTAGTPPPPPPPPPPAAANGTSPPPQSNGTVLGAPKLMLAIPVYSQRSINRFLERGLTFQVTATRPVADVDVRLFEVLGTGLRPMGSAFRVAPGPAGAKLTVEATRFARGKLSSRGRRTFRAIARATGRDGAIATTSSTFHVY